MKYTKADLGIRRQVKLPSMPCAMKITLRFTCGTGPNPNPNANLQSFCAALDVR